MICLQSVDFLKSMRWKCEICFPSYCFLLSTKFQLAFIETCDASLGWNKGTRVQPFFFRDRRFHWLIGFFEFGGGKEETASLKCEKRGRAFLWETLSNTPPRLDDRGREPCHSFCASVWLTSLERSCCFSFVLLVFRHVFTHRRKNLFLFDTLAFLWV